MIAKFFSNKIVRAVAFILAGLACLTCLALVPAAWNWALSTAPQLVLQSSGVDVSALQPEASLKALTDSRTSVLSLLGSVVATAVACAALAQAHYARRAYVHKREIDWSSSFSASASMLDDKSDARRLAAVAALCALADSGPKQSKWSVLMTLAAYVRSHALESKNDDSLRMAVTAICSADKEVGLSIAGANLSGLNLTGLSFHAIQVEGVTFRNCSLSADQEAILGGKAGVDTTGVKWQPVKAGEATQSRTSG